MSNETDSARLFRLATEAEDALINAADTWRRYPNSGAYEVASNRATRAREEFLAACTPARILGLAALLQRGVADTRALPNGARATFVCECTHAKADHGASGDGCDLPGCGCLSYYDSALPARSLPPEAP